MSKYTSINEINKKGAVRTSGMTVQRYKEPTSDRVRFQTQFIADYGIQQAAVPVGIGSATQNKNRTMRTMNSNGRSSCCGPIANAFHGSAPKDRGNF